MLFSNILTNDISSKIQIFVTSHLRTLLGAGGRDGKENHGIYQFDLSAVIERYLSLNHLNIIGKNVLHINALDKS